MVDICRRRHPQQPKLELFQPCLSPWRAMVSSKEVALAVFHCSVAKHHAKFESACPSELRNWQVSRYLPESCDETFQSEWGQKQSDSSVQKIYLRFSLFLSDIFSTFCFVGLHWKVSFWQQLCCICNLVLSDGSWGIYVTSTSGAMIWVTFPKISSKFTAQVANIPSCHCRIASDQAMLAKSMALSWRTDLFTPSPKVFRKRGWSIDIEAKHHLSVSQFKRFKHPCSELVTYIKHHETYIWWKSNMHFNAAFHFISFCMLPTIAHTIKLFWLYHFISLKPQGDSFWLTFDSPVGEILLSYTKLARSRGATSTEVTSAILRGEKHLWHPHGFGCTAGNSYHPESIVFSLGALPNLFGSASTDCDLSSIWKKGMDMYRKHWGRDQETNYDWLGDQETTTSWARLKPVTYWLNWICCVNI